MFNKTIFKQTAKANVKILAVITMVLSVFMTVLTRVFDPATIDSMKNMMESTPLSGMLGNTTFLGLMAQSFYTIQGVILPLVFIIVVGSGLVVSQVDRGSMAYTLSTPIKRTTVVFTQAVYFSLSLAVMVTVFSVVGIFAIQTFYGTIWGEYTTADVEAVSPILKVSTEELHDKLYLILEDESALEVGAEARNMSVEEYTTYLNMKIQDNINKETSVVLGVEESEVVNNPQLILESEEATRVASELMNLSNEAYTMFLTQKIKQEELMKSKNDDIAESLISGFEDGAEIMGIEVADLTQDLELLKENEVAFDKVVETAGVTDEILTGIINKQIANEAIAVDNGIDFEIKDYVMLNVGLYLLMFATSGVSFLFSCIFNLTKNYMALGAGIPLAFFLFHMMANVSSSLEVAKYFTINTLYNTETILTGEGYILEFISLFIIGLVLYGLSIKIFKEKDLPL